MLQKIVLFLSFVVFFVVPARNAVCQLAGTGVRATGVTPEANNSDARAAIHQALAKKIDWDFTETSLSDVAEYLHKELNIPVRLDLRALSDLGVTPDTPITFKLSGISAKSALNLLLSDLSLATMVRDEVLLITSRDVADVNYYTVLYDVSDLPAFRRPDGKTAPDFESLIEVITKSIKPIAWGGGSDSIVEFNAGNLQALVVSQTEEVHEEIANLLTNLRKLQKTPLTAEDIEKLPSAPLSKPKERPQLPGAVGSSGKGEVKKGM